MITVPVTGVTTMTTAEAVVETLLRHGVRTVYGVPGVHNDPLFDAFYFARDRLRLIHTRHEQGAAYMALGAALATGQPQVFTAVPGPGFLNTTAALLTAFGMNAPVIGVIGQIPQHDLERGHGVLHEIRDQLGLAGHISKYTARIGAAHEAPALVADAIHSARSGRPRPAILECPMDVWGRRGAVVLDGAPRPPSRPPVDEDAVAAAARILGASQRPLIVVGGGAIEASGEVVALAEMLEAPVVAYRRGQGVVPAAHRLNVSLPIAHRLWADADVVLGIGTRLFLQQSQWGVDDALKVVRVDIDPEEPDRLYTAAAAVIADAADGCGALLRHLPAHNRSRRPRSDELAGHRAWLAGRLAKLEPQAGFLRAIRAALPPDGIFVDEVTQIGFASRIAFPVHKPRTYFSPGYQDTLGWGLGAALGIKVARPDVPVLAIAGDGGFMYQVGELATAVQHGIAVIVVVFDNKLFGNVRLLQETLYGNRTIASDLVNPDFVKLAESFGVAAWRATDATGLERAIVAALSINKPALIHVPCGPMPSPWDLILMPKVRGGSRRV
jgi:acetolactate synthase-1/2/3 large subunit